MFRDAKGQSFRRVIGSWNSSKNLGLGVRQFSLLRSFVSPSAYVARPRSVRGPLRLVVRASVLP